MPVFSTRSKRALAAAHPMLQTLFNEVIKEFDCVITESRRGRADQEKAFREGHSNAHFGQSAHNWTPAVALDVYPYPIVWDRPDYKNGKAFIAQADVVRRLAKKLGIPIRWGGDWDGDGDMTDQKLMDLPHFELNPWRKFAEGSKLYNG